MKEVSKLESVCTHPVAAPDLLSLLLSTWSPPLGHSHWTCVAKIESSSEKQEFSWTPVSSIEPAVHVPVKPGKRKIWFLRKHLINQCGLDCEEISGNIETGKRVEWERNSFGLKNQWSWEERVSQPISGSDSRPGRWRPLDGERMVGAVHKSHWARFDTLGVYKNIVEVFEVSDTDTSPL